MGVCGCSLLIDLIFLMKYARSSAESEIRGRDFKDERGRREWSSK